MVAAAAAASAPAAFAEEASTETVGGNKTSAPAKEHNFKTYTTDIVVIGSGLGGIYALDAERR